MSGTRKLISILVVTFALGLPTFAWGPEGHMAVAYVAYQHLNPATKARVDQLLKLNPDYQHWKAAVPSGTPAATSCSARAIPRTRPTSSCPAGCA